MNDRRLKQCAWIVGGLMVMAAVAAAPYWVEKIAYSAEPGERAAVSDQLAKLADTSKAFRHVAKLVRPSVVGIQCKRVIKAGPGKLPFDMNDPALRRYFDGPFRRFFRDPDQRRQFRQESQGSGVIVDERGYILTNNHVVQNADTITVKLADDRTFKAKLVGRDSATEVAVIQIEADNLHAAKLGNSEVIEVGDWVLAIGSPFGLSHTVTAGIISAKGRSNVRIIPDRNRYENFIQTDAAINPGNSGGPLVNLSGEVVGINTAIYTRSGGYMGIGFAVPINLVRQVMNSLINTGKVTRGYLGVRIQDVTEDLAKAMELPDAKGVLVPEVFDGTPAKQAGVEQGDVILMYDGKEPKNVTSLRQMVAVTAVGTRVPMVVLRKNKRITLHVTVAEQPKNMAVAARGVTPGEQSTDYGLAVRDLTPELAKQFGYETDTGVIVSRIDPDSPAQSAGLRPGDLVLEVDRQKAATAKAFADAVNKHDKKRGLLLLVKSQRGGGTGFVILSTQ